MQPGECDAAQIADARAHLSGHALRKRLHNRVGERVAGTEARDHRLGEVGVRQRSFRRDNMDRARQPHILRHISINGAIEKDGSEREPDGAVDGAFKRHVDRPVVDLRRGAGQIDGHFVAAHFERRLDLEIAALRLLVVQETVDRRLGGVIAVGQRADRVAHQPLGIVHEILRSLGRSRSRSGLPRKRGHIRRHAPRVTPSTSAAAFSSVISPSGRGTRSS